MGGFAEGDPDVVGGFEELVQDGEADEAGCACDLGVVVSECLEGRGSEGDVRRRVRLPLL